MTGAVQDGAAGSGVPATEPLATVGEGAPAADGASGGDRRVAMSRRAAIVAAVVLALVLAGLLFYLYRMAKRDAGDGAAESAYGLEAVMEIGGPATGERARFDKPMGVAFGPEGRIYVADSANNRIVVFSRQGRFLFEFGQFGVAKPLPSGEYTWAPGRLNHPTGIDVDERGMVYVADFRNDQIQVFDAEGKFIRRFPDPSLVVGKGGSGQDGTGIAVTDVCVRGDRVYATDAFQVFVFGTDGKLLLQFGRPGPTPGDLDHPNGVAVGEDGTIYVSDSNHNRVTAFSADGRPLWNVGAPIGFAGEEPADGLGLPRGLAVMPDGSVLVADAFNFELVRLTRSGKIAARLGSRGSRPAELNFPNDVDVEGDLIVVADRGNDRVQVVRVVRRGAEKRP